MSLSSRRWVSVLCVLTVSGAISFWNGWAHGQAGVTQLGNSAQIEKDFYNKGGVGGSAETQIFKLVADKAKEFPPDLLEKAAKFCVYRVTWPSVLDGKSDKDKQLDPIAQHVKNFNDHISKVVQSKNAESPLADVYGPVLVAKFRELTDLPVVDNSKALVWGMQMLPALARLQTKPVDDFLIELIDPKTGKHDLIKLQAIRALREFEPVAAWYDPFDQSTLQSKPKMARKESERARVEALTRFILRPPPEKASNQEIAAYRFLRREAIESLGAMGSPAVTAVSKLKIVEGPIAPVLLRVLIPGNLDPETSLQERNEAALALCNLKPIGTAYEPGPTYYFVGQTFIDVCKEYSADFANIAARDGRLPPAMPWRTVGKRWEQAFSALEKNATNPKDKQIASQLKEKADPLVKKMYLPKQEPINPQPFSGTLLKLAPPPPAQFLLFREALKSDPINWQPGGGKE